MKSGPRPAGGAFTQNLDVLDLHSLSSSNHPFVLLLNLQPTCAFPKGVRRARLPSRTSLARSRSARRSPRLRRAKDLKELFINESSVAREDDLKRTSSRPTRDAFVAGFGGVHFGVCVCVCVMSLCLAKWELNTHNASCNPIQKVGDSLEVLGHLRRSAAKAYSGFVQSSQGSVSRQDAKSSGLSTW